MKLILSDREKYIVHFLNATITGIRDNASERAINCAINTLKKARCENLPFDVVNSLTDAIVDETAKGSKIIRKKTMEMSN